MKRSQPGATFPPMGAGGANPPQHFRQWQRVGQIGRNITANESGRGKSAATLPPTAAGGANRPLPLIGGMKTESNSSSFCSDWGGRHCLFPSFRVRNVENYSFRAFVYRDLLYLRRRK